MGRFWQKQRYVVLPSDICFSGLDLGDAFLKLGFFRCVVLGPPCLLCRGATLSCFVTQADVYADLSHDTRSAWYDLPWKDGGKVRGDWSNFSAERPQPLDLYAYVVDDLSVHLLTLLSLLYPVNTYLHALLGRVR